MDIGFVIPHLAYMGGAIRFALECLKRWQYDHDITLYVSIYDRALLEEYELNNIKIVKLTSYEDISEYIKDPQYSVFFDQLILPRYWNLDIGRHDVYHCHFFPANILERTPIVWYPHEPFRIGHDLRYELKHSWVPKIYTKLGAIPDSYDHVNLCRSHRDIQLSCITQTLKKSTYDVLVSNSEFTAKQLKKAYELDTDHVVYPGTYIPSLDKIDKLKNSRDGGNKTIVTVVNLEWHKRIDLMLQAMMDVDDAKLVIIGYSNEEHDAQLEKMLSDWGVESKVIFLRLSSDEALYEQLAKANCFLFVSLREPFGIAPVEALAFKTPVIAVDEGGYTEVLNDEAVIYVKPYPGRIATALNTILDNPDLEKQMGEKGREIAEKFTWNRTANELENIMQVAINKYNGRNMRVALESKYIYRGAIYKLDYENRHPDYYTVKPLLGYYDSSRGYIIEQHIKWAIQYGLNYFAISVNLNDLLKEDDYYPCLYLNLIRLADLLERDYSGFYFSILLTGEDVINERRYYGIDLIYKSFAYRESYLRLNGIPVIFNETDIYDSTALINKYNAIWLPGVVSGLYKYEVNSNKYEIEYDKYNLDENILRNFLKQSRRKNDQLDYIGLVESFNDFKAGIALEPNNMNIQIIPDGIVIE